MHAHTTVMIAALLLVAPACSHVARDTPTYERDTSALLDTRADALQACYDAELARNPSLVGKLTVQFEVEKKTGKLIALEWDHNRSSVSETLATCVVSALYGLALAEPDRRDAEATFTYVFRVVEGEAPAHP